MAFSASDGSTLEPDLRRSRPRGRGLLERAYMLLLGVPCLAHKIPDRLTLSRLDSFDFVRDMPRHSSQMDAR